MRFGLLCLILHRGKRLDWAISGRAGRSDSNHASELETKTASSLITPCMYVGLPLLHLRLSSFVPPLPWLCKGCMLLLVMPVTCFAIQAAGSIAATVWMSAADFRAIKAALSSCNWVSFCYYVDVIPCVIADQVVGGAEVGIEDVCRAIQTTRRHMLLSSFHTT